jgi:hypothetical protein
MSVLCGIISWEVYHEKTNNKAFVNVKLKIHNYSAKKRANVAEKNTHSQPFFNNTNRVLFPPSPTH